MSKSIIMITGVPGSGKTTFMDGLIDTFNMRKIDEVGVDEYRYIESWASLPESQQFLRFPEGGGFDILPEGYWPMSEQVGEQLAGEIHRRFDEGLSLVVFETARGVGEPRVDYSDFVEMIERHLPKSSRAQLVNIEVISTVDEIAKRMIARYREDPEHAPPPGIERKYLREDGNPLCYSTENLASARLRIPLVFNEKVTNGAGKEAFQSKMEVEVYPRLFESIVVPPRTSEGQLVGPERM